MRRITGALVPALFGAGVFTVWTPVPSVHAVNSIVTVDQVGFDPSLVLDAAGNPVISYCDVSAGARLR
jgi:hypothetical protein